METTLFKEFFSYVFGWSSFAVCGDFMHSQLIAGFASRFSNLKESYVLWLKQPLIFFKDFSSFKDSSILCQVYKKAGHVVMERSNIWKIKHNCNDNEWFLAHVRYQRKDIVQC